jgi:uncharacterized FAD-dependent dehydrogenase
MQHYDVAIIGGGIGGLMSAYELATKAPGAKVVLFEKGHDIEKRACPIVTEKAPTCIKCPSCAIMEGLAGAGAFSDGKYVISTEYGGCRIFCLPNRFWITSSRQTVFCSTSARLQSASCPTTS